jgi:hypothetical protein
MLIGVTSHFSEALGKGKSIAVVAAWADLDATGHGIPSGICPFNQRLICHGPIVEQMIF